MFTHTDKFSNVHADEIQVGDIVRHHGAIMVVTGRHEYPHRPEFADASRCKLTVYVYDTKMITYGAIPRELCDPVKGWPLQGNELASWTVLNR